MANHQTIGLEEGWKGIKTQAIERLEGILDKGLDRRSKNLFKPKQYAVIYTICYNMCTQRSPYNWSEQLYQRHGESFQRYLTSVVLPALKTKHNEFLLAELVSRWKNHKLMNKWMQKFFMYLDRYYVRHHSLPTLHEAGLHKFKKLIFDVVKKDVVDAILMVIKREREGELVDQRRLANCISVFEAMGMKTLEVYQQDFEEHLLANTQDYYQGKSQVWEASDSTPEYMKKAERALTQESDRVRNYLHPTTEPKILRVCETELLAKHEQSLLNKDGSGCRALLRDDKKEDLARMYNLFSRVPDGLEPIATMVQQHIQEMGLNVVSQREAEIKDGKKESASDPTFVQALLALHAKYRKLVDEQFQGNALFQKAMKEAFEGFVNKDVGKYTNAEMMSTFCDRILKTGGEKLSDELIEKNLEDVVQLFSYLTDKDFFAEIYRNQLAKRLLNKRSKSDDAERSMISKLKLRCGAQFTSPMEGMLNDLSIGTDHQRDFTAHLEKKSITLPTDFSVQVLTTGFWPSYQLLDVKLPKEMAGCTDIFEKYYLDRTSHRTLKFVYSLGNATVRATFTKKWFDLQITTLQTATLLAFNGAGNELQTFPELKQKLGVEDEVLKRLLHSLSCGKYKVLAKKPKGRSIKTTDKFLFNKKFSCPMKRIRIPMASLEASHDKRRVEEDRSIAIEAAIVRIMKARKVLQHQQLVTEVLSQLAFFKPNPKVVKRRIEHLIDREYLERDPDTPNMYRYLA